MNFLQLVQRAKLESGRSTNGASPVNFTNLGVDDRRLVNWVADAWRDLQQEPLRWNWKRTSIEAPLTAGVSSYTPAALGITSFSTWREEGGFYGPSVYEVGQPASEWELSFLPYDEFRRTYIVGQQVNGQPFHWSIAPDKRLLIGPAPSGDMVLRADFDAEDTELVAETDEPLMPAKFHMVLVWRALVTLGQFDAAGEVAQRAIMDYTKMHKQLEVDQAERVVFYTSPLA